MLPDSYSSSRPPPLPVTQQREPGTTKRNTNPNQASRISDRSLENVLHLLIQTRGEERGPAAREPPASSFNSVWVCVQIGHLCCKVSVCVKRTPSVNSVTPFQILSFPKARITDQAFLLRGVYLCVWFVRGCLWCVCVWCVCVCVSLVCVCGMCVSVGVCV